VIDKAYLEVRKGVHYRDIIATLEARRGGI